MSQPARRFSADSIFRVITRQSWVLFILVLVMIGLDMGLGHQDFGWSKNVTCGGLLAWLGHYLFAQLALRTSGAKYKRQVVNNFYLAQAVKWLITLLGFAMIFISVKPLIAVGVFFGYFSIQLTQILLLYHFEKYKNN